MNSLVVAQILEPDGGLGSFTLPGGYLDGEGVLHNKVVLRSLRGVEEKILASRSVKSQDKLDLILAGCVTKLGEITDPTLIARVLPTLPIADRTYLLLSLRVVSHGELLPFKKKCPECGQSNIYQVNLRLAEVFPMEDPYRRVFQEKLPSGIEVTWAVLTGAKEAKRDALKAKVDMLTLNLLLRVETLADKPVTQNDLEQLSVRDRDFLRQRFDEAEGGVDTEIQLECPFCSASFETDIDPSDSAFFFPGVTQNRWKRKLAR